MYGNGFELETLKCNSTGMQFQYSQVDSRELTARLRGIDTLQILFEIYCWILSIFIYLSNDIILVQYVVACFSFRWLDRRQPFAPMFPWVRYEASLHLILSTIKTLLSLYRTATFVCTELTTQRELATAFDATESLHDSRRSCSFHELALRAADRSALCGNPPQVKEKWTRTDAAPLRTITRTLNRH